MLALADLLLIFKVLKADLVSRQVLDLRKAACVLCVLQGRRLNEDSAVKRGIEVVAGCVQTLVLEQGRLAVQVVHRLVHRWTLLALRLDLLWGLRSK